MRYPLIRSRAFWLGVPGLLFLLWSWADSTRNFTQIEKKNPAGSFSFVHWDSAIKVCRAPVGSPFAFSNRVWRGPYPTKEPVPTIWWPAVKAERDYVGRPFIRIPHWLLLLAYLALWSAGIAWRRRCWRKALRAAEGAVGVERPGGMDE